MKCDEIGDR